MCMYHVSKAPLGLRRCQPAGWPTLEVTLQDSQVPPGTEGSGDDPKCILVITVANEATLINIIFHLTNFWGDLPRAPPAHWL